jgi:hypothetical protein
VQSVAATGDEVVIREGLAAGDRVAAAGAFKLYEGARVAIVDEPVASRSGG